MSSRGYQRLAAPDSAFADLREALWLARDLRDPLEGTVTAPAWRADALVPAGTPSARVARFSAGLGLSGDGPEEAMIALVAEELARGRGVLVAPHPLARPGDEAIAHSKQKFAASDDAVYFVEPDPRRDRLRAAWRAAATAAGQLGFVTPVAVDASSDVAALATAASAATLVALSAYDGDGVLLFTRAS